MSKQLAISASYSVFAMVAFAVLMTPSGEIMSNNALNGKGAAVEAAAPSSDRIAPAIIDLLR